ncbi:DUF2334 domain-containing protein [Pseudonocardia sp. D17]|uniref:DUF2334 domain-containing protein n=1 Tax=Pseudonocardia sp. D17 TaxID=882661 RepID=UPI002B3D14F1|nr:DUF2334 domain-containing protein [Pseudonocardia sp. D17]
MTRLVVSLSGLTADPRSLDRAAALAAALDLRGVPLSHLFRPRLRRDAPDPGVVAWLGARRGAGDAILLHGFDHTPDPIGAWQASPVRLGRRAEFALLPRHEAGLRVIAARRAAHAVGLDSDLFAPPRWLASSGTIAALRDNAFALCADDTAVRALQRGTTTGSRVLGFRASGERRADRRAAESWRCRLLVAEAGRVARRGGLVRIGLRAKDLRRPERVAAALTAVDAVLAAGARPLTYAEGLHAGAA